VSLWDIIVIIAFLSEVSVVICLDSDTHNNILDTEIQIPGASH